jgi:hypothetical protein
MQIGFVGLGRMGLNMVTRLVTGGHVVVAYDRSADAVARAAAAGAKGVSTLEALIAAMYLLIAVGGIALAYVFYVSQQVGDLRAPACVGKRDAQGRAFVVSYFFSTIVADKNGSTGHENASLTKRSRQKSSKKPPRHAAVPDFVAYKGNPCLIRPG